jgi:hypothetical protein
MYVFVTSSVIVIPRPLPDGQRLNRPFGSIPARWWIYDLGRVAGGRFHRFADLLTGIDGCENFVRVGVQIFGDDEGKIDTLMSAAAKMRIEAPLRLADADAVAAKCAGPNLADRP